MVCVCVRAIKGGRERETNQREGAETALQQIPKSDQSARYLELAPSPQMKALTVQAKTPNFSNLSLLVFCTRFCCDPNPNPNPTHLVLPRSNRSTTVAAVPPFGRFLGTECVNSVTKLTCLRIQSFVLSSQAIGDKILCVSTHNKAQYLCSNFRYFPFVKPYFIVFCLRILGRVKWIS